jgi:hypothetical protein
LTLKNATHSTLLPVATGTTPRAIPLPSIRVKIGACQAPHPDLAELDDLAPEPPPVAAYFRGIANDGDQGEPLAFEEPKPFATIPPAMQQARRWLVWRAIPKDGRIVKQPLYVSGQARHGKLDGPEDLSSLATFDQAQKALKNGTYTGLGFALGPDGTGNAWQGIDLDHIDERPELAALGETLPGYRERSPSRTGLHAIGYGQSFKSLGSNTTGIEAYAKGRYFTVTGEAIGGNIEDLAAFVEGTLAPLHSPAKVKREPPPRPADQGRGGPIKGDSFHARVNAKALLNLSAWVTALLPMARPYQDGYRVESADLGRDLEEAIGILPQGIRDFGQEEPKSAIDLVIDWGPTKDATEAACWLCRQMGIDPAALGWTATRRKTSATTEVDVQAVYDEQRAMLAEFGNHHAIVMIQGRAVIVYREIDADTGRHVTRYSTPADISLKFRPLKVPLVEDKGGRKAIKRVSLFPLWLESEQRTTYQQLVFKPVAGLVAGPVTLPKTRSLNLYQGLAFAPAKGSCEGIKEHIQAVWCSNDPTPYNYAMDWLARMFQRPQERGHTVIVLRSGEGTGKNIIVDMLVAALGEHALVAVRAEGLVGRFNDDLATSVLVFANEAVWGGDKALEGALKSLITDEELPVERKYIPKFRVTNCVHLMMASNTDWVAPIGLDDRRFVVLDVSEARKGDHAYFAKLVDEIENGGREAFIHELLTRDISKFNPRVLPEMRGHQSTKFDAKVRGADSVTQWWIDCLYAGEIMATVEEEVSTAYGPRVSRGREDLANGWEGEVDVSRDTLYGSYVEWANLLKRRVEANTSFGKKLTTLAGIRTVQKGSAKTRRTRVYVIPTLKAARATLDAILKQRGPWHDEDSEVQS